VYAGGVLARCRERPRQRLGDIGGGERPVAEVEQVVPVPATVDACYVGYLADIEEGAFFNQLNPLIPTAFVRRARKHKV
jgi:hypothetical protein